jgi:hypothetical protein
MSDWSKWSDVDATGSSYRYRYVLRPALNGGHKCDDLLQLKKGEFLLVFHLYWMMICVILYWKVYEDTTVVWLIIVGINFRGLEKIGCSSNHSRNIGKPNNLKVFGASKPMGIEKIAKIG